LECCVEAFAAGVSFDRLVRLDWDCRESCNGITLALALVSSVLKNRGKQYFCSMILNPLAMVLNVFEKVINQYFCNLI